MPKVTTKVPTFEDRYKALNKAQAKAVDTIDGPVMVIAGPGSGKTELLSLRVGNILKVGTARASSILCLTFTETAARNMRERLESLIGADAYRVAIYTFHGFCTDIIGRYPEYFFEATHFRPASDLTQSEILETIFERLPHKHVLGGYHSERGYAYLKECQSKIKDIKKGGLTPVRFKELIEENAKIFPKLNAIVAEHLPERVGKDSYAAFETMKKLFEKTDTTLGSMYASTIGHALTDVLETEKNTPLSSWKTENTGKGDDGKRVLKDSLLTEKLLALGDVYQMYQDALYKGGYFDYEDMILQVVEALRAHVSLRTELEEQYQYIMVDEFQDTNNAQLSLVKAISSNPVHEGRPNVCVVGDDDQAIYKFQGAEISNIHSFRELYSDVEVIVLTENYRSTQKVLDFARAVVVQGVNRLETRYKEIRKDLVAKNTKLEKGEIYTHSFPTEEEEYAYIAEEVARLLKEGKPAKEIALIAREHKQLILLLPYLDARNVPYTYTRKENVFDERHVQELITLCRFLATVGDTVYSRDDLLPQILSFSFWGLNRLSIWQIAEYAKREHCSWLEAMKQSSDEKVSSLALFFIELGIASQTVPLEIVLDILIGSKDVPKVTDSPDDDVPSLYDLLPEKSSTQSGLTLGTDFVSPYKSYYFGENALKNNASTYIHFLSSLRVFMRALREYREGEQLRVHDVGNFVDMHTAYNIPLINETPFAHNENSVQLLTSHGAKGLEFAYVFIVSVNDAIWAGGKRGSKLSFPVNLPLTGAGDNEDDFIRLFYVALTRARHTLYITHTKSPLRFLSTSELPDTETVKVSDVDSPELVAHGLAVYHVPPFAKDERALLEKVVEGYMLSPTHLNNFLNIIDGGPMMFLEQNLLRFPQAKTASSVYGTAIHKAIEDMEVLTRKEKKVPVLSVLVKTFAHELKKGRLLPHEEEKLLARGEKVLARYYELESKSVTGDAYVELDFSKQSVMVDGALLTGKIDKVLEDEEKNWTVVDLKTGKGFSDWEEAKLTAYDEIKLHHYRYQLMMYKILVENSRDYREHTVTSGILSFVEEEVGGKIQELTLTFNDAELARFKKLMITVYAKIAALDFPGTEKYPKTLDGIKEFEEDLLA